MKSDSYRWGQRAGRDWGPYSRLDIRGDMNWAGLILLAACKALQGLWGHCRVCGGTVGFCGVGILNRVAPLISHNVTDF